MDDLGKFAPGFTVENKIIMHFNWNRAVHIYLKLNL